MVGRASQRMYGGSTRKGHLLEFTAKAEFLGINLSEPFRRRIHIVQIPLELVFQFHGTNDDIELNTHRSASHSDIISFAPSSPPTSLMHSQMHNLMTA